MGTPLSGYTRRFVGATGEPGIQGSAGADGADGFAQLTPISKTANYTIVGGDIGTYLIKMNVASSNTVTIPPASTSFSPGIGDYVFVMQYGVGATTIVAGSGVTIRAVDGILALPSRYAIVMLVNLAENEWVLSNWSTANLTGAVTSIGSATTAKHVVQFACGDETTAITASNGKITIRMPFAMTLTSVRASLVTAQTSGSIFTVDINESGTSILSTKLTIDNGEKTSTTAATPAVISDTTLADDAEITVDVDQIGDGTAKGLKVTLIGTISA